VCTVDYTVPVTEFAGSTAIPVVFGRLDESLDNPGSTEEASPWATHQLLDQGVLGRFEPISAQL
jgi:hypothetical protein